MARSDIDKAAVLMVRTPTGLKPAGPFDAERLDQFANGATVEVSIKQRRSGPNHRHFFATLGRLVESGAVPFNSTDELLDALKFSCGLTELRKAVGGAPYFVPASISFAAKDEPAFRAFKEQAFNLIATHYGVDPETVLEERAA